MALRVQPIGSLIYDDVRVVVGSRSRRIEMCPLLLHIFAKLQFGRKVYLAGELRGILINRKLVRFTLQAPLSVGNYSMTQKPNQKRKSLPRILPAN